MAYYLSRSRCVGTRIIRRRRSLTAICHCFRDRSTPHADPQPNLQGRLTRLLHKCTLCFCTFHRGFGLVTTNLPFDEWTEVFGSERLTGALLDRLPHHIHILEMNGDSRPWATRPQRRCSTGMGMPRRRNRRQLVSSEGTAGLSLNSTSILSN